MRGIEGDVGDQKTFPGCTHDRVALSKIEQEPFHHRLGLIEIIKIEGGASGKRHRGCRRPSGSNGPPKRFYVYLRLGKGSENSCVTSPCRYRYKRVIGRFTDANERECLFRVLPCRSRRRIQLLG